MDDGYWESLLQDVDNETERFASDAESEDTLAQGVGTTLASGARKWAGMAPSFEEEDWQRASALLQTGETVNVVISGYNRGGLLAEFGSIQGFLPASHLVATPASPVPEIRAAALAARVSETLIVRVVEIDRERCRLILSERMARGDGQVEAMLAVLEPGQVCRGTVTNLCAFGAFVDLGGFEGLIHISELSWGRVESAGEVIQPGDRVEGGGRNALPCWPGTGRGDHQCG
jgi:small subunit ribosomal protein S1